MIEQEIHDTLSRYSIWVQSLGKILIEKGIISKEELIDKIKSADPRLDVSKMIETVKKWRDPLQPSP